MRVPQLAPLRTGVAAAPATVFLLLFLALPVGMLLGSSLLTETAQGQSGLPFTLAQYHRLLETPLYRHVLATTLRISFVTMALAAVLGYPVASVMACGAPWMARLVTAVVIAPLVVSVVVRTYGWQLILANSNNGLLNWALHVIGIGGPPLRLLYTETAVVIGSLHVYFPMMVLPLASALAKADPALEEAARTLGAPAWQVFRRVTLPLSLPGLVVGCTLVFTLTASSYVTPAILGGTHGAMLGMLIQEQVMAVFDWPFGSAIATVLIAAVLLANCVGLGALRLGRHLRRRAA